ncbi:MAG: hypothetical protein ACI85O_002300 [Saprospiraceae bacterium]|jgi:hypothetical protein
MNKETKKNRQDKNSQETTLSSLLSPLSFLPLAIIPVLFSLNFPFFWDTIQLSSKHAHHFFEHNFSQFFLPSEMDSGHFPAFGMYLAALWKIFGRTLAVSHLALLPFLIGLWYFLFKIGNFFLGKKYAWLLVVFTFSDPVFAGQSVLVSPDIAVMFFFLMGLNAILHQKKIWLGLAAIGLAAMSMRGMMVVLSLYFFSLLVSIVVKEFEPKMDFKKWFLFLWNKALPYVPSGLLSLAFLAVHYQHTGWIGYHVDSPWATAFEKVDFMGFVKNCAVYVWRILDFGRIFLLAFGVYAFYHFWQRKNLNSFPNKFYLLLALLAATLFCLSPSVLIHKGLLLHRYLLPVIFTLNLLAIYLLLNANLKYKNALLTLAFIGLATGNFWVYPKHIAQGWDATLAHVPYYELREEMIKFIDEIGIKKEEIGSAFPNISGTKYTDLAEVDENFVKFDLDKNNYILYSNVMNDFSDEELMELEENWIMIEEIRSGGVCFVLYSNLAIHFDNFSE